MNYIQQKNVSQQVFFTAVPFITNDNIQRQWAVLKKVTKEEFNIEEAREL